MTIDFADLLTALALLFVLEGIMPFLNPEGIRKVFTLASQMRNQTLRFMGLTSMIIGLILLYIVR